MAKKTKSGLGRGLDTLIGGTFTNAPASPSSERERIVVDSGLDEEGLAEAAPETTPSATEASTGGREQDSISSEADRVTYRETVFPHRALDEVSVDSISPNPEQPRTNFKEEELEELAASIEKEGLLQPILVRDMGGGKYQIIAGERRWQACKLANLETVPVRIKEVDADKALELALVENVQRSDLNPIEEAYGYKRLMERGNRTQEDVAQAMSKGRSTVANALRLLDLPAEAQQLLFEDKISAGHARAILSIPTFEGRQTLTNKLVKNKLSVREAESLARLLSGKPASQSSSKTPVPATYKTVAKALRDILKTDVRVKSSNGKNKIEITFKDEDELERLFEELIASAS